ncbi:hypothetical protein EJ05DRAFT_522506 [Pseudovirgaria hyperparasitica]|uniref:Helitron helicase-like domain-containing protein n=1 Tax=Pseudovirgaria hyperparasitica TaxID=470096 RepID=A0A6A6WJB2_9PEZI|nr:uncharacterized protein EJ05DRAFT_522506 [Pseudovirgaria hyperparasitica]KAF2762240.1 hypothetical protein EJ05DRAFT_522506 [Pseudovirgaria hyperparasitica]
MQESPSRRRIPPIPYQQSRYDQDSSLDALQQTPQSRSQVEYIVRPASPSQQRVLRTLRQRLRRNQESSLDSLQQIPQPQSQVPTTINLGQLPYAPVSPTLSQVTFGIFSAVQVPATRVNGEIRMPCCGNGKVQIPVLPEYPPVLRELLLQTRQTRNSTTVWDYTTEKFRQSIRHYNQSVSFVSAKINIENGALQDALPRNSHQGVYTLVAKGELLHFISNLRPDHDDPKYAQLYIYDNQTEQGRLRRAAFQNLHDDILRRIEEVLYRINPFIQTFRMNAQTLRDQPALGLSIGIIEDHDHDPRRWNTPNCDEIAGLLPVGPQGEPVAEQRDVVLRYIDGTLRQMSDLHATYLPMRFPLLFPHGSLGWNWNYPAHQNPYYPRGAGRREQAIAIPERGRGRGRGQGRGRGRGDRGRGRGSRAIEDEQAPVQNIATRRGSRLGRRGHEQERVSQQMWWNCFLQRRPNSLNPVLHAGRLFHEVVIDAWASIQGNRLAWWQ